MGMKVFFFLKKNVLNLNFNRILKLTLIISNELRRNDAIFIGNKMVSVNPVLCFGAAFKKSIYLFLISKSFFQFYLTNPRKNFIINNVFCFSMIGETIILRKFEVHSREK